MRRWHEDLALMENRVKFARKWFHLDETLPSFRYSDGYYRWREVVQQPGKWRKRKPLDCGRVRCGICHGEKFYRGKARNTKKLAAIRYELDAEGGE